ncbi:MAG: aminotransferase class IV [Bacteroidales bacterium]|nr:aminotransferase class IV [Bacteroidales bacterium]MBN2762342.1 aminotransferase class IV [Bacteroidales bacterium]
MTISGGKYICYNGDFINAADKIISPNNRSFRYGDALFESIRACGTEAQFLDLHLNRLKHSMQWLKMTIPAYFTSENLSLLITKLLNKNRIFGGARIRLTVIRNPGGLYAPEDNTVSFVLESETLESDHYSLNPHGLIIDLYTEMPKPVYRLSSVKSTSALFHVLAGIYKTENKLDDCILVNTKGHLVESISSNIFILREGHVFTPGTEEGCLPGIMRQVIISCFRTNNQKFSDNIPLMVSDLLSADEVFFTNAIAGIRWVGAFRKKRYYRDFSQKLIQQLNQKAFGQQ